MSSTRSRSAGLRIGKTASRKNRSSRNVPVSTAFAEVLVGRREHANVDVNDVLAADARDVPGLHGAQHLGLRHELHVADLVEEERSPVGLLEETAALEHRAGERALLVAEQLALDELPRDRRAVHLHEGAVGARAEAVQGAGDKLLAGAALAGDEDRGLGGGDLLELPEEALDDRAAADHLVAEELLLGDPGELLPHLGGIEHVAHADEHALSRERLLEEIARPELDGLHRVVHGGVPADDDDGQIARALVAADLRQRVEAAHVRQLDVEDGQVDRGVRAGQHRQRLRGGLGAEHAVSLALEHELQRAPDVLLVVDDEHRSRGGAARRGARRAHGRGRGSVVGHRRPLRPLARSGAAGSRGPARRGGSRRGRERWSRTPAGRRPTCASGGTFARAARAPRRSGPSRPRCRTGSPRRPERSCEARTGCARPAAS